MFALSGSAYSNDNFTFEEVTQLPSLAEQLSQLDDKQRLEWLNAQLAKESTPVKKYRLQRLLALESFNLGMRKEAAEICESVIPLRDDFIYRNYCADATADGFDEFKSNMENLIYDTRQAGNNTLTARFLGNLAWQQSQEGDIAGSFASYEAALSVVPEEQGMLMNNIMFDTASNYIVHGDDAYVQRGVELLSKVRKNLQEELNKELSPGVENQVKLEIALTYFNSGIAYMLHLYDYEKALEFFNHVNSVEDSLSVNSLSFSALAAAILGRFNEAKQYIEQIDGRKDQDPVVEQYLNCYRQLAMQHWNSSQSLTSCLSLDPDTTVEVKLDLFKRLSTNPRQDVKVYGLEKLRELFIEVLEPQIRSKGSSAASNVELIRLQKESALKSLVLEKEKQLNQERSTRYTIQRNLFIAIIVIIIFFFLLVYLQLKQKRKLAEQYQQMSVRDSLTQLGNRRFLEQQIERELAFVARAVSQGKKIALGVYIFDIDHFKRINDTYGHAIGDEVLKLFGARVKSIIRETDLFVRWGGEEFVYIARLDSNERMKEIANRILMQINSQPFTVDDEQSLTVTCTIGAVQFPFFDTGNIEIWTRLISLADAALYYGKENGRNCWVVIKNEGIESLEQLEHIIHSPLEETKEQNLIDVTTSYDVKKT